MTASFQGGVAQPAVLVFEMTWSGTVHAPGNGATLQTIVHAMPGSDVHMFAEAAHLREVQRCFPPSESAAVRPRFHPITISRRFASRTGIVSLRRMMREMQTLRSGLRHAKAGEPCLLVLLSATPTAIFAASWLARLRGRTAVQIGLHGNLNELGDVRSRNPVRRRLDLLSAMQHSHGGCLRFLVLEPSVRAELARRDARAAARTDVLPLPANVAEIDAMPERQAEPWPPHPLRVGFVGMATQAKGIDIFLDVARRLRERHGSRIEFHLIGRVPPNTDLDAYAPLAEPPAVAHLPRADFVRRLAALHYVMLPFRGGYYDLAASGALIDAVTWCKPVIATRIGFVDDLFAAAGDVGHLCDTPDALCSVLEGLLAAPDADRYARQTRALLAAREARMPRRLAAKYWELVTTQFPFLFGAAGAAAAVARDSDPDCEARSYASRAMSV